MAEKDDLLKKLGELAEKLGRDAPTSGTNAELKAKVNEWESELAALDDEDDGNSGSGGGETGDNTDGADNTNGGDKPKEQADTANDTKATKSAPASTAKPALVRFTALATLHVNAVDDNDRELAVVVKDKSARLPETVFNQLLKRKLVKKA